MFQQRVSLGFCFDTVSAANFTRENQHCQWRWVISQWKTVFSPKRHFISRSRRIDRVRLDFSWLCSSRGDQRRLPGLTDCSIHHILWHFMHCLPYEFGWLTVTWKEEHCTCLRTQNYFQIILNPLLLLLLPVKLRWALRTSMRVCETVTWLSLYACLDKTC